MAKDTDGHTVEWFGADVEEDPERKQTTAEFHGFEGVDADVPRSIRQSDGTVKDVVVRMAPPRYLRARTTAGARTDHDVARKTARFKLMREGFRFAPPDDKETWEKRMNIALAEMQVARFEQKLARYRSQPNPRPEQIDVLQDTIDKWRGRWMRAVGQEKARR